MRRFTYNHAPLPVFLAILISFIIEMIVGQFISPSRDYLMLVVVCLHMLLIYASFRMTFNPQMMNYLLSINITRKEILKGLISAYVYAVMLQFALSLMFSIMIPNIYIIIYKVLFTLSILIPIMYLTIDADAKKILWIVLLLVLYQVNIIIFIISSLMVSTILFYQLQKRILEDNLIWKNICFYPYS